MRNGIRFYYGLVISSLLPVTAYAASALPLEQLESRTEHLPVNMAISTSGSLAMPGSAVAVQVKLSIARLNSTQCRETLELTWNQPFEKHGLRITELSRSDSTVNYCASVKSDLAQQAKAQMALLAVEVGFKPSTIAPAVSTATQLAAINAPRLKTVQFQAPATPHFVALHRVGTVEASRELMAVTVAPVFTGSKPASHTAPQTSATRAVNGLHLATYTLTASSNALLRASPSLAAKRVGTLQRGEHHQAKLVAGAENWYQITDMATPCYVHESVVSQGPASTAQVVAMAR